MADFFNGRRRNVAVGLLLTAIVLAACVAAARIRTGLESNDHQIVGPVFVCASVGVIASPVIGGAIAAFFCRRFESNDFWPIVARGVYVGSALSALCFAVAKRLACQLG